MNKIEINFKQLDNVLDLANFLKYFLRAEVNILPEDKNSIALVAHMRTNNIFARYMKNKEMTVFVFMNKTVRIFFHDNPVVHMFKVSPENFEATDAKFTEHSFKTIQGFIDFIQPHTVSIEFPAIDTQDLEEIDLEKRKEALSKWKEVLEKLIPYGVLVQNQLSDHISDASWIFELHLPVAPVPKEDALKNEYLDEYHYNYEDDHLICFYPGDKDWNKQYKHVINHLKKLYAFEEVM